MARIHVAEDKYIEIPEPQRAQYPQNLGGAVNYTIDRALFWFADKIARIICDLLAGAYARVNAWMNEAIGADLDIFIPGITENPEIRYEQRQAMLKINQKPGLLGGLGKFVTILHTIKATTDALVQAYMMKALQKIMRDERPQLLSAAQAIDAARIGAISTGEANEILRKLGYSDAYINAIWGITTDHGSIEDYARAFVRGQISSEDLNKAAARLGVSPQALDVKIKNYRRMLELNDVITALFRNAIDENTARAKLSALGFSADDINVIMNIARPLPGPSDLVRFAVREAFRDDVAERWRYDEDMPAYFTDEMRKWGFDDRYAKYYWRAHWKLPSVTLGRELVYRGAITEQEFEELLRLADYPAEWRRRIMLALYQPLTRVDVRRMYRLGVLNYQELIDAYKQLGYDDRNAQLLAEFTVKYETPDPEDELASYQKKIENLVLQYYRKGLITRGEVEGWLRQLKLSDEKIQLAIEATDMQRTLDLYPDISADYVENIKRIADRLYSELAIDRRTYESTLKQISVSDEEINYRASVIDYDREEKRTRAWIDLVADAYRNGSIDRTRALEILGRLAIPSAQQETLLEEWDRVKQVRTRRITLSDATDAWQSGIINEDEYRQILADIGYCDNDIEILVKLNKPAPPPAEEEEEEVKVKLLSESQYRKAWQAGIITEEEYISKLRQMGYTEEDARILAELYRPA